MEGNRDEAERCIEIAVIALREAKLEKAEKFLKKAENLFPSQKAKGWLDGLVVGIVFNLFTLGYRHSTKSNVGEPRKGVRGTYQPNGENCPQASGIAGSPQGTS